MNEQFDQLDHQTLLEKLQEYTRLYTKMLHDGASLEAKQNLRNKLDSISTQIQLKGKGVNDGENFPQTSEA